MPARRPMWVPLPDGIYRPGTSEATALGEDFARLFPPKRKRSPHTKTPSGRDIRQGHDGRGVLRRDSEACHQASRRGPRRTDSYTQKMPSIFNTHSGEGSGASPNLDPAPLPLRALCPLLISTTKRALFLLSVEVKGKGAATWRDSFPKAGIASHYGEASSSMARYSAAFSGFPQAV